MKPSKKIQVKCQALCREPLDEEGARLLALTFNWNDDFPPPTSEEMQHKFRNLISELQSKNNVSLEELAEASAISLDLLEEMVRGEKPIFLDDICVLITATIKIQSSRLEKNAE